MTLVPRSLLLVFCGVAFSCAGQPPAEAHPVQVQQASIIKGEPTQGFDAVLFLFTGQGLCTAALIAPRVVVTAKHCVVETNAENLFLGTGATASRRGAPYAQVQEIRTTAGDAIAGQDIAVLILDKSGAVEPLPWGGEATVREGDTVRVIGYGQQVVGFEGQGTIGNKAQRQTRVRTVVRREFSIEGPTSCFGDSGGPALDEETGQVLGIVSRGVEDCDGDSVYTRLDPFRESIDQAIADTAQNSVRGTFEEPASSNQDAIAGPTTTSIGFEGVQDKGRGCSAGGPTNFGWLTIIASLVWLCLRRRNERQLRTEYSR